MGALERYDHWEAGLVDGVLARDPDATKRPTDPPPIEDISDQDTLMAIDAAGPQPPVARAGSGTLRGGVASGALAAGLLGVGSALDDIDDEERVVEIEQARRDGRLEPVSVYLAWGDPAASVAVVRRWLF